MAYYRRLPGGKWQATIRTPSGKRRTRTDPLKSVVRAWAEDAETAIRRGEWADPKDGRLTLTEWWEQWSNARVIAYATQKRDESHWKRHVEPRWGATKIASITAWDVEGWIAQMKKDKVGATSLAQSVRLLRHMLADAARHKMIPGDPTATVRIPTPPKHVDRFLTRQEAEALREAMPTPRDRAMVTLMTWAGLRWSEAAGLHAFRLDVKRKQLTVVEVLQRNGKIKEQPKSSAGQRIVPTTVEVLEDLAALEPDPDTLRYFPSIDYSDWRRRVFVLAVERAGIEGYPLPTPHDCRHSFGSWLAEAGVPPHEIMKFMGHGTLRATERYLHAGGGAPARMLAAMGAPRQVETA